MTQDLPNTSPAFEFTVKAGTLNICEDGQVIRFQALVTGISELVSFEIATDKLRRIGVGGLISGKKTDDGWHEAITFKHQRTCVFEGLINHQTTSMTGKSLLLQSMRPIVK